MSALNLAELRKRYVDETRPVPAALEAELRADPRAVAQTLLKAIERRRRERRSEGQRLRQILKFEQAIWATGVERIAGIDEAGMSPLAGPVSAGAVIFAPGTRIEGVDDSKKLDAAERDRLAPIIRAKAVAWCVAFATPAEIDHLNIYWASLLAMRRALAGLGVAPQHLLIDARRLKGISIPQERIVKGDSRSLTIAAASILAKTTRDAHMVELEARHPGYGFAKHKGYPVKSHVEAITRMGVCIEHRRSFAPVRKVLGLPPLPAWPDPSERGDEPTDVGDDRSVTFGPA